MTSVLFYFSNVTKDFDPYYRKKFDQIWILFDWRLHSSSITLDFDALLGRDVWTQQTKISIGPILFLCYEESLVRSNLNSKQIRFHGVRPNKDMFAICIVVWVGYFSPPLLNLHNHCLLLQKLATYQFWKGTVKCQHCLSRVIVKIGFNLDWMNLKKF